MLGADDFSYRDISAKELVPANSRAGFPVPLHLEVTITEVLEKKVRYRGRNELEATAKAEADYYAEKIVLGADDFSYRDISAKELVPVKERRNSR